MVGYRSVIDRHTAAKVGVKKPIWKQGIATKLAHSEREWKREPHPSPNYELTSQSKSREFSSTL
jgi:hypothetical protein